MTQIDEPKDDITIRGVKPIGHKFYKIAYDQKYLNACVDCGTIREKGEHDYSFNSQQYCPNCGKSFRGKTVEVVKPIYVIGHFKQWDGKNGYQLSHTNPNKIEEASHNGKGWSYYSYTADRLGKDFYATKAQLFNPTESEVK